MNLIVIRHGETNENIEKILQGNMDTVLNQIGREQAQSVAEKLATEHFDVVFSSPMKRTMETAQIVTQNRAPIFCDDRLKSRNHGEFEGLSRKDMCLEEYWNIKENRQYKTAERVLTMYQRVEDFLQEIFKKYHDKTVLLVTHSGNCRILYYYFNGIPEDGSLQGYESTNCSIEHYEMRKL